MSKYELPNGLTGKIWQGLVLASKEKGKEESKENWYEYWQ